MKGSARIRLRNGRIRLAEIHWYEARHRQKRVQAQGVPRLDGRPLRRRADSRSASATTGTRLPRAQQDLRRPAGRRRRARRRSSCHRRKRRRVPFLSRSLRRDRPARRCEGVGLTVFVRPRSLRGLGAKPCRIRSIASRKRRMSSPVAPQSAGFASLSPTWSTSSPMA